MASPSSSSTNHGKRYVALTPLDIDDTYGSLYRLVHGSLARAGKVKSQTPKVEPQEKKKDPKGRAKKRMLYNRRYVQGSFALPCRWLIVLFQICQRYHSATGWKATNVSWAFDTFIFVPHPSLRLVK